MSAVEPPPFLAELGREFARVAEADAAAADGATARSRRLRLRRFQLPWLQVALPLLLVVAALGGIGVVATGVIWRSGESTPGTSGPAPVVSSPFSADLLQRLSVLRRERTAADAIDSSGFSVDPLSARLDPDGSLRVTPPAPTGGATAAFGQPAWLLPTDGGGVALVVGGGPTPGVTPAPLADIQRGRAVTIQGGDVIGLVPDGVPSVTVRLRSGGSIELPVQDNVWGAHLGGAGDADDTSDFAGVEWSGMPRP